MDWALTVQCHSVTVRRNYHCVRAYVQNCDALRHRRRHQGRPRVRLCQPDARWPQGWLDTPSSPSVSAPRAGHRRAGSGSCTLHPCPKMACHDHSMAYVNLRLESWSSQWGPQAHTQCHTVSHMHTYTQCHTHSVAHTYTHTHTHTHNSA